MRSNTANNARSRSTDPTNFQKLIRTGDLKELRRRRINDETLFEALRKAYRDLAERDNLIMVQAKKLESNAQRIANLEKNTLYDQQTGAGTPAKLKSDLADALAEYFTRDKSRDIGILVVDGSGVKKLNDVHGREFGNAAIMRLSKAITLVTRSSEESYRLNGGADEFAILFKRFTQSSARSFVNRLYGRLDMLNKEPVTAEPGGVKKTMMIEVSFSSGSCSVRDVADPDGVIPSAKAAYNEIAEKMISLAISRMSSDKENSKKAVA